jgi:hypothetical protein
MREAPKRVNDILSSIFTLAKNIFPFVNDEGGQPIVRYRYQFRHSGGSARGMNDDCSVSSQRLGSGQCTESITLYGGIGIQGIHVVDQERR